MTYTQRKLAFVLAGSAHGPVIVNRLDYGRSKEGNSWFGVGAEILEHSAFSTSEVGLIRSLLGYRRKHFGDGVFLLDCGANIGVHTIEAATEMTGWGSVLAIEAQERIYYALAGNIALNNCFNARAIHAAVAREDGVMRIPVPDYLREGSFGSLELRQRAQNEFIGQAVDYSAAATEEVRSLRLDSLSLSRIDLIKMDIEGMEEEAISGAQQTIARHKPILLVEYIKSNKDRLVETFGNFGYSVFQADMNLVMIDGRDPSLDDFRATLQG